MTKQTLIAVAACIALGACAGRAPAPVPVVGANDKNMDCASINIEVQANSTKLKELGREEGSKVAQNVAAGVVGLFVWPVLFAMDFQNAAGKETQALQARQQYLATMAEQRGCAAQTTPSVTVPSSTPPVTVAPSTEPTASGATQ